MHDTISGGTCFLLYSHFTRACVDLQPNSNHEQSKLQFKFKLTNISFTSNLAISNLNLPALTGIIKVLIALKFENL